MPTVRETHKWRLRQQFCSLSEESKEVGWGNKAGFTVRGTHLSASAQDRQLQVAKEMPSAYCTYKQTVMFTLTGYNKNKEEALINPF